MVGYGGQAKGVTLTCEHTLWFKQHLPSPGEEVWCARCQSYQTVPNHDSERPTYYPEGNWDCYRKGRGKVMCRGVCRDCGHEYTGPFHRLRGHMEKHHRLGCVENIEFEYTPLPPNSPPPF